MGATRCSRLLIVFLQMSKLVDTVQVASARAAIVWVVGEYCHRVPLHAPDVLRKMAKSFCTEQVAVKQQVVNLAVKLYLTNPGQTSLLAQYVFNLAKFDQNYDLRDRVRFIRAILFPKGEPGKISKHVKKIFLATKPAPKIESKFANRDEFQLGSLSHFINARAAGYQDLPSHPEVAPDPGVRLVEVPKPPENTWKKSDSKEKSVGSKAAGSGGKKSEKLFEDSEDEGNSESSSDSESDSSSGSEESSEEEDEAPVKRKPNPVNVVPVEKPKLKPKEAAKPTPRPVVQTDESSDSSSSEEEEVKPVRKEKVKPAPLQSNLDLLLDLTDAPPSMPTPTLTPSLGGFLSPAPAPVTVATPGPAQPMFVSSSTTELLNKLVTGGVGVDYRYTRHPHLYCPAMVAIELTFSNQSGAEVGGVKLGRTALPPGMAVHEFPSLGSIPPGQARTVTLGVDYKDTTQAAKLDLVISGRPHTVSLACPMGELVRPLNLSGVTFMQEQARLTGMHEMCGTATLPSASSDAKTVTERLYSAANLLQVPSVEQNLLLFAGQTVSAGKLVLLAIALVTGDITINTENIVLGSMVLKEVKAALEK